MAIGENQLYLLSYYRISEITGALFFGQLARMLRPGPVQMDMTRHFADEAAHAQYWTEAIRRLGAEPLKLRDAYQDRYNEAIGVPANLMEVLAVTQVFERRVINAYARHQRAVNLDPVISETIGRIMQDEKWHLQWIGDALTKLEPEFGKATIEATIDRYWRADKEVYARFLQEHEERVAAVLSGRG